MQTKIFIGIRIQADLKFQLPEILSPLQKVPYGGKEYLGLWVPSSSPTLTEIRSLASQILAQLQEFLPDTRLSSFPLVLFPQQLMG